MALPLALSVSMNTFFGRATAGFNMLSNYADKAFAKFNPAGMMIFQRNLDNLNASLGGLMAPAIELVNKGLIQANRLFTAWRPAFETVFKVIGKGLDLVWPLVDKLLTHWIALSIAWEVVINAVMKVVEAFGKMIGIEDIITDIGKAMEWVFKRVLAGILTLASAAERLAQIIDSIRQGEYRKAWRQAVDFSPIKDYISNLPKANAIWDEANKRRGTTQAVYKAQYTGFDEYAKQAYASSFGMGGNISPDQFYSKSLSGQDLTNQTLSRVAVATEATNAAAQASKRDNAVYTTQGK